MDRFEFIEEVDAQFKVDRPRRRISGMILPWGKVAQSGGYSWAFERGSVYYPSNVGRVKLLRDHDTMRAVGRAVRFDDRVDGLHATFYVMRGTEGDAVIEAAEDGVLDGFSVGPIFENPDSWRYDADAKVRRVSNARLVETTITALPAFDDARVLAIQAHRSGVNDMGKDNGDGSKSTDAQTSNMEQFQAEVDERFKVFGDKLAESQEAQTEAIGKVVADAFAAAFEQIPDRDSTGRGEFAAARIKLISEPPVYRFNGDLMGPSLVRDHFHAMVDNDHEARDRLRKFQAQTKDLQDLMQKFAVTTTNAASVIPPGYRPDLFVNELNRGRPVVAQSSRGTITDATPFKVPRFVSAAGATLDHVEGTNPAGGTLTLDQATVSPVAISGRFELTREIVDSSNPAIDAIALAAMRESYNRQTEQKAYAALNNQAVAPLVTDLAGAVIAAADPDDTVIRAVRDLLAQYPFTRFAAPTGAVINQAVTRNFANANDTTNRPLLPSIGAQNTAGLGNAVQQGWFVDGLPFVPAWAMGDAVNNDVAIVVNSADFWTWESPALTFRFEEKQGPAIIELALFAYYATHVLRPAGLAAINKNAV